MEVDGKKAKLQIWDTAGQERYKSITAAYYKGAKGALIVYDTTQKESFENIDKWIESTKKCILKCKDDDMYNKKFEYKNVCYENCPNEYYTKNGINICKCRTNIACKDCDENGSCYSCNNDKGYYHKKEESESEMRMMIWIVI